MLTKYFLLRRDSQEMKNLIEKYWYQHIKLHDIIAEGCELGGNLVVIKTPTGPNHYDWQDNHAYYDYALDFPSDVLAVQWKLMTNFSLETEHD